MNERPILFSAPMVRAILAGTKTQTRRIVKLPRSLASGDLERARPDLLWGVTPGLHVPMPDETRQRLRNPWGWPELSRLWVRETFAKFGTGAIEYRSDDKPSHHDPDLHWTPSIFMPRAKSRITLEVTSVRVERLQAISETDAMAEGAEPLLVPPDGGSAPYVEGYHSLWDTINGAGAWDANPWVWVVEFKRIPGPTVQHTDGGESKEGA